MSQFTTYTQRLNDVARNATHLLKLMDQGGTDKYLKDSVARIQRYVCNENMDRLSEEVNQLLRWIESLYNETLAPYGGGSDIKDQFNILNRNAKEARSLWWEQTGQGKQ